MPGDQVSGGQVSGDRSTGAEESGADRRRRRSDRSQPSAGAPDASDATPTGGGSGDDVPTDEELLHVLARAARQFDPPPPELTEANRLLFAWRDPDALLAELVADSRELAGATRAPTQEAETLLHFAVDDVNLFVQAAPAAGGVRRILGEIESQGPGSLVLRRRDSQEGLVVDQWGRFVVEHLPGGPISFRWTPEDPSVAPVETSWTLL